MTFILGSRCKDGVVLVADRKVTINEGEDYEECDKLFGEIGHVIYGSSGDAGMFELFRGYVTDYVNTHRGEINFQNAVVKLALCVLKINKEYGFPPNLYDILVATQPPDKPSTLKLIQGSGTPYTIKNYQVIGSGSPYGQVFLKKRWRPEMTMQQVAELGYFIIKYIENYRLNFTVGGTPTIWFIPDEEKDDSENKVDYKIAEKRPDLFKNIEKNAKEQLRKHEQHLSELFSFH
jgi:20S proteasome alpha/beta subunit